MSGLLGTDYEDPKTQGILGFALNMLANSGPVGPGGQQPSQYAGWPGMGGQQQPQVVPQGPSSIKKDPSRPGEYMYNGQWYQDTMGSHTGIGF